MKKVLTSLVFTCLCLASTISKCSAKDEYYFYKATNTKASTVNASIEQTITNKNYKVIANDKSGDFYFIPVQMTFWDGLYYGKARIRYAHYFVISTKQKGEDCYLTLSKNYMAERRKLIVLTGINNKEVKLKRISKNDSETKSLQAQVEKFKATTQSARKKMVEEISGGNL